MEGMFVALGVVKLTEWVQKIKRTFYCFGNTGPCLHIWVEGPDLFVEKNNEMIIYGIFDCSEHITWVVMFTQPSL